MRNAFAAEITELASKDSRVVLLSGDIGNKLFNKFRDQFPDRFYNCGVAEANMTGMAAGMALSGLRPVTYTINSFNTYRCFEQIRVDLCYHNLPVVLVGVGAGLSYASLGATHHSCEDIAIMRALPNMTVICPGDPIELKLAMREALLHTGPVYLRIGKKGEPVMHKSEPDFKIGKGIILKQGSDVCLISTGNMLPDIVKAAELIESNSTLTVQIVSMHTVKPLDTELLKTVFGNFKLAVTVEEHSFIGGLGAAVAEYFADMDTCKARLLRFALPDKFLSRSGSQKEAHQAWGLTPENIAESIIAKLKK